MEGAEDNREKFDLLREFTETQSEYQNRNKKQEEEDEDQDMELSLGLSMNGRFGVDHKRNENLKRASSIANLRLAGETVARGAGFEADAPLWRAQSLPAWTEEESRRRKELQLAKWMEARKKRMDKLKNLRVPRDGNSGRKGLHEVVNGDFNGPRFENGEVIESSSQGSMGPVRSGSSASSDLIEGNGRHEMGMYGYPGGGGPDPMGRALEKEAKGERVKKRMREMPYVRTRARGGPKVEGFLYGYKKGEDVKIMCVCHGRFLTPNEFVQHGGAQGDVQNPLKHIVVCPFPLL